jgi:superfamily II DNA/RNA helicase
MGYETMTPIQEQAIPVVLEGSDVMVPPRPAQAKLLFSLPLLQRMMKHENARTSPARHPVRALVLLPTRELADQVAQQVKLYASTPTCVAPWCLWHGHEAANRRAEKAWRAGGHRPARSHRAKNAVLNQVDSRPR